MRRGARLVGLALVLAGPVRGEAPDARALLDRMDDLFRGNSARGRLTMAIATSHWRRELTVEFTSRGKDRSLLKILAPARERGTATLMVGRDLWNYLPKVNRVVKLPSSMMGASWMGSHFTNDDLVKESRLTDDYDFAVTFTGTRDGEAVVEIRCEPKAGAAVVWGRILVTIGAEDGLPHRALYYGEDLTLARTLVYSDVRDFGGRRLPAILTITPADKPGESTTVTYEDLAFDVDAPDSLFSLRSLTNR